MKALAPHMGATRFTRWIVKSSELPFRWDDALKRSDPAEERWNSPFASETPGSPARRPANAS
jgi:hypothetical protein